MSRGHGARQRAVIGALREWGSTTTGRSAAEITRSIDGPRYTAAQLRSTQRAIAALLADGSLLETRRAGKYNGVVGGGKRLRVYLPAPGLREKQARYPCPGCGRNVLVRPPGDDRGQGMCRACLLQDMHDTAMRLQHDVRTALGRDETLKKLVALALDTGATDGEALAALRAARKRTAR